MTNAILPQARLKQLFHYDPDTGVLTRITNVQGGGRVGKKDWCEANGYYIVSVDGEQYYLHILAWIYMTGDYPNGLMDHINRDKKDNRFANLREATSSENAWNVGVPRHNTSGYKGVTRNKRLNTWTAGITFNGKRIHLGNFSTPEIASVAYHNAAKEYHGEFYFNRS